MPRFTDVYLRSLVSRYAFRFIGTPYKWGGETPMSGYDCSGFVQEILRSVGKDPKGDQTAQALYDIYEKNKSHNIQGNLVFWPKNGRKTHVAILFDENHIIEAGGGGSRTIDLNSAIKDKAFVRLRPLDYRGDNYTILDPFKES